MDLVIRPTAHMKHSEFLLPADQDGQMGQASGDSHRIHLPHQGTDPFFIPEDIGEIRELASDIVVGDAQVIPICMPSGEDVEISPRPLISVSYHPSPMPSRMGSPGSGCGRRKAPPGQ